MDQLIAALPYLACPIGMGLMMWMMSRRQPDAPGGGASAESAGHVAPRVAAPGAAPTRTEDLAALRAELAQVRDQQEAIARAIETKAGHSSESVAVGLGTERSKQAFDSGAPPAR